VHQRGAGESCIRQDLEDLDPQGDIADTTYRIDCQAQAALVQLWQKRGAAQHWHTQDLGSNRDAVIDDASYPVDARDLNHIDHAFTLPAAAKNHQRAGIEGKIGHVQVGFRNGHSTVIPNCAGFEQEEGLVIWEQGFGKHLVVLPNP
jgi:hypothetical protein